MVSARSGVCRSGGMVDAPDSKSGIRKGVRVRVSPSAPNLTQTAFKSVFPKIWDDTYPIVFQSEALG